MLLEIASFLLDVITGLVGGACLLRLYMQRERVGFGNPLGRLVFALTNWIVLPLRRVVPPLGGWDIASLLAAYALELLRFLLLWLLAGMPGAAGLLPLAAVFGLARLVISGLTGLLIVYAVLSWTQPDSPVYDLIDRLCAPPLRPVRRLVPLVGGVDLSVLVLVVALQVAAMVLNRFQGWTLFALS